MDNEPEGLRLEIVDDRGGVAATLGKQVLDQLDRGSDQVVVLAGYLCSSGVRRWLLHDHTADAVAGLSIASRAPWACSFP